MNRCLQGLIEKNVSLAMPLQQEILSHVEISPESKVTVACDTIVKVPTANGFKLVGQNTESECYLCSPKASTTDKITHLT